MYLKHIDEKTKHHTRPCVSTVSLYKTLHFLCQRVTSQDNATVILVFPKAVNTAASQDKKQQLQHSFACICTQ